MNLSMLGLIDASTKIDGLDALTENRTLAALPFGGRYRLIDFSLSNMVNSGIKSVAIFPGERYGALMDHLGSGRAWDLNRKRDGLFVFPSEQSKSFFPFENLKNQLAFLKRAREKHVIIASSYVITSINYREVVKKHIETQSHITMVRYMDTPLNMYVISRELLIQLITEWNHYGLNSIEDVVNGNKLNLRIHDYEHSGFVEIIDSVESYYNASLELLEATNMKLLFKKSHPILTKVKDEPSTKYTADADVKNGMIANGCVIQGKVENSVISRAVKIGKNSVVRNSVIMQKCVIGDNCIIENAILDKDVKILDEVVLRGTQEQLVVIPKGVTQGALVKS